jgi:hypothetical protein
MAHRKIKSRLITLQACGMPGIKSPTVPMALSISPLRFGKSEIFDRADDQNGRRTVFKARLFKTD